jgi:hypothetical protein
MSCRQGKWFSSKASVALRKAKFFEPGMACNAENISGGELGKSNLWKKLVMLNSKSFFLICRFLICRWCTFNFRALGQNYFPFWENFCAKSIMAWQVNSGYDTSYAVAYQ